MRKISHIISLLVFSVTLHFSAVNTFADPPTLPTCAVNVARDMPDTLSVDPSKLTRPTKLYTVCSLGGQAEHGFIKDGKVYAPGGGGVACWDLKTGKVLARYTQIVSATMPILEHGLLVGPGGGYIVAVSIADGKTKWKAKTGGVGGESLAYWDDGKDRFVFAQASKGLYKIHLDDGKIAAQYPIGSNTIPAIDKKRRVVYAQTHNLLVKLNGDDLSKIWELKLDGRSGYASPIIVDESLGGHRVIANTITGNIYCVTPDGKIDWQHLLGGKIHGLLTYRKGILYEHGYPSIVRAVDINTGKEQWRFDAKDLYDSVETFWTAPLFIGNRILIPTADGPGRSYNRQKYFVLDPENGHKLGQFEFDAPGSSCGVPMASAGIVIFHDNLHSRWTAVKVGEGEDIDWYPFRGDNAHSGAPSYQEKIVTKWYDEPQLQSSWWKVRDWLFLDRFDRHDAEMAGKAVFPPLVWKSEGPQGSTAIRNGELVVSGAGKPLVGVYNEYTAAPVYTAEGTVTLNQTDAPNQWFVLLSSGWLHRLGLMAHSDGYIYYMDSTKMRSIASSDRWVRSSFKYEANNTYAFKIQVDCQTKTGEYFLDGKKLGKGLFAKYDSPICVMAATKDSSGSFRLGEVLIYRGTGNPPTEQPAQ